MTAIATRFYPDHCDHCYMDVDDWIRFPHRIEPDGTAYYRCPDCGRSSTCWWGWPWPRPPRRRNHRSGTDTDALAAIGATARRP